MYKPQYPKSSNRNRILECIYRNRPVSRTRIAALTDITPATTTLTVNSLINEGILIELGEESPMEISAGRKRISLDINASYAYAAGVEFNQTALSVCITDLLGNICHSYHKPYTPALNTVITNTIIRELRTLLSANNISDSQLIGIGIAVPGHMNESEEIFISNRKIWENFHPHLIREAFHAPVVLENNVRCMALGQYLFSPETTTDSFAYFHVGMGMFCANVIEGSLFLGDGYVSGEIGHTIVNPNGQACECGKHGCLQTIASERAILQNARRIYDLNISPILNNMTDRADNITLDHIANAYALGDASIASFLSNALLYLGVSASNIAIIMNPEKFFLHGKLFNYPEIRKELEDIIEKQLSFVGTPYVNTLEILDARPSDGATGACALAILRCFLQVVFKR